MKLLYVIQVTLHKNLVPLTGHLIYSLKNSIYNNHIATTSYKNNKNSSIKSYSIISIILIACKKAPTSVYKYIYQPLSILS